MGYAFAEPLGAPLLFLIFGNVVSGTLSAELGWSADLWWIWALVAAVIVFVLGFDPLDAYQLVTQISESPVANVCDPNYTFVAKAAKRYLPDGDPYRGIRTQLKEAAATYRSSTAWGSRPGPGNRLPGEGRAFGSGPAGWLEASSQIRS